MQNLDLQLDYWDRIGPNKPFSHPVNAVRLRELLTADGRIIEYGCGYGRALGILEAQGFTNLTGFDPAPSMVAAACSRFPKIDFRGLENPPQLPISSESVDAAILLSVLTCVPTDDGQRAIITELGRVLRAGGLLHISDLWLQGDRRNRNRYEQSYPKYRIYGVFDLPEGVTLRHHSRPWIEELTEQFVVVGLEEIEVTTMNGHSARGFQWFGRKKG
jgi:SAM-dependent methyltransferase